MLGKLHTEALQTQRVENPQSQDFCLIILQICQSQREGTVARGPHPQRILRLTTVDWTRPQTGVAIGKANAMFSEGPAQHFQLLWWACARGHDKDTAGTSLWVLKEGAAIPMPLREVPYCPSKRQASGIRKTVMGLSGKRGAFLGTQFHQQTFRAPMVPGTVHKAEINKSSSCPQGVISLRQGAGRAQG